MKARDRILIILLSVWMTFRAFGQTPPPNDDFTNSTVLTGTDLIFSGSLAGASIEDSAETNTFGIVNSLRPVTQSVWWSWTAPSDTVLTLQVLSSSVNDPNEQGFDMVSVYSATNGTPSPAGLPLPALAATDIVAWLKPQTITIPVAKGSNYAIQVIGSTSATYTFHLIATNLPVILEQPRSQTVFSNASATFYALYAGFAATNFTFQWQQNGTNLSDETTPILSLTNIDGSMAGTYALMIGNSFGSVTSAPATLAVSQSNFPVTLSAAGFNASSFAAIVNGEFGRSYRLESSTDLVHRSPEQDFEINPLSGYFNTSVFFQTNSSRVLSLFNTGPQKFFRVTPYVISQPDAEICINNLRQIRIATLLWRRDFNPSFLSHPLAANILPYLPHHILPMCPDDLDHSFNTSYNIFEENGFVITPTCAIRPTNHYVEEPR